MNDKHHLNLLIAAARDMSDNELKVMEAIALLARVSERVLNLLRKREPFLVIGEHEPYYLEMYATIREYEKRDGTWSFQDEMSYQVAKQKGRSSK